MKEIRLTYGEIATISDADFEKVMNVSKKWNLGSGGYVRATVYVRKGKTKTYFLHKVVLSKDGYETDHIDRNKLNNTRENLRLATGRQNTWNRVNWARNTSGFIGVVWSKRHKKWRAQIGNQGKCKYLGYFTKPEEAARAYDTEARRLRGEFAVTNF